MVVGGLDHLVVAHGAARLDHGGGARFDRDEEPVGEGKECVGRDHVVAAIGQEARLARELALQPPVVVVDPQRAVAADPDAFRQYVQNSAAEFSPAQGIYVETNSGWFSDRTVRYLASGKPALVQDTGWAAHLPSGDGLLAFTTPEEALAGIDRINSDYPAHARRAAEIAREHFDATRVLPALLDEAGA